jgi:hypothetical protein
MSDLLLPLPGEGRDGGGTCAAPPMNALRAPSLPSPGRGGKRRGHLLAWALAAMASVGAVAAEPPPPRLVVLLVVDGLPKWQVDAYRDQLAPDGLRRFLARGARFEQAHHTHASTVTAAGHATLLTGATPSRSGIIGNDWRDPRSGEQVYCTSDAAERYIGETTQPLDGTSPRNLRAETVGDVLRRLQPAAKVVGVSGKDRGAILTAGHAGTAYMYMDTSGRFASSSFYMQRHPAWVDAFNAARPADRWFRGEWRPLLPDAAYAPSLPDDQPWFGERVGHLPMRFAPASQAAPDAAYYDLLVGSPFVDQMTLEFALAAVEGEKLGRDAVPDLLAVSLSGHDLVNHAWSAESRLSHDHLLQLDRKFQEFFRQLDARVGRGNYVAVFTSDHGFMPAPGGRLAQGLPAGRVPGRELVAAVNTELERRFGVPRLIKFLSASSLVLDRAVAAQAKLDPEAVLLAARDALAAQPAVGVAYTRGELESGSRVGAPFFEAMQRTWNRELSGDVQFALRPYWMFGPAVATHGSPYDYDTHVPLMFWGPRWIRPGAVSDRVEMVDLAPTLARLLRVPAPAQSEGRLLPLP